MKKSICKSILCVMAVAMTLTIFGNVCSVKAATDTNSETTSDIASITIYDDATRNKNGTVKFQWNCFVHNIDTETSVVSYELQSGKDDTFTDVTTWKTSDTSYFIPKSFFGKNGGTYYARVRVHATTKDGTHMVSNWSETKKYSIVAINKTNFPGLYKLLKNGGSRYESDGASGSVLKKIKYDTNKDGWLDTKEIFSLTNLDTVNIDTKKNGTYTITPSCKVTSFEGVEYLEQLSWIHLAHFSGTSIDLSKNKSVTYVFLNGVCSTHITVNAPTAKEVCIQTADQAKMLKIDLSKCDKAIDITAYGQNETKKLILPTETKHLKILSISDMKMKTLDVNDYSNLKQLYIYRTSLKKISVNKCVNLHYLYLFCCEDIHSLDLSRNKKLKGIDLYNTDCLMTSNVKKNKSTKLTREKGKWWYETESYRKEMENLYN